MISLWRRSGYLMLGLLAGPAIATAQGVPSAPPSIARVEVSPRTIAPTVGDSIQLTAREVDAAGKEVPATLTCSPAVDAAASSTTCGRSQLTTAFRGVLRVV